MEPNCFTRHFVAGCLLLVCGCATPEFLKFSKDDFPTAGPKNPVGQVLALWQPSTGPGLDHRTGRGFAGQILFFTQKNAAPAKVDGTVRIYLYDDQGTPEEQAKPIHQFDFNPEAWAVHAHMGKLGLAYTVFVPYVREGTYDAHCSLRLRYTPREGPAIFSEMVNVAMPGRSKDKDDESDPKEVADADDDDESATESTKHAIDARKSTSRGRRDDIQQIAAEAAASARSTPSKSAIPLSDAERDRIVREARARLLGDADSVKDDQTATLAKAPRRLSGRHILNEDLNDDTADIDDERDDDTASNNHRSAKSVRRQHVLSDTEKNDDEQVTSTPTSRPSQTMKNSKASRKTKRHLLKDQESQNSQTDGARRRETLTLSLSGIR